MRQHIKKLFWIALFIGIGFLLYSSYVGAAQNKVYLLTIDGAISPAHADYFSRGLDKAIEDGSQAVILKLNTPGGLDKSMREMIQRILDSPIPIIIYVSPKGARAASAGTYLIYASHVAAMAPATNLGSATPVSIGIAPPTPADEKDKDKDKAAQAETPPTDVMQKKQVNDAKAYIRSLAQLRGRNEQWAVAAVSEADNISAQEALDKGVIELISYDTAQLLAQLDGREVNLGQRTVRLDLKQPEVIAYDTDWRTRILVIITDPSIAYLLLLAGIYGLVFEFLNPGTLLPGTLGSICLLLAMYAFNMLPISFAGLALLLLGLALMVAEAFAPSFGVLGIGGICAFALGSFMLMDSSLPGYQIAPALIISMTVFSAVVALFMISMIIRGRSRPVVSGDQELLQHEAEVIADFKGSGRVMIRGEVWLAFSEEPLQRGQKVKVIGIDGLTLMVTRENDS
ncbi:nodulation protein NfeD [Shewanella sp. AS16]|uniref:NfeD family protein n=1 Tax=Shewanella sp. AS16 TaxID=2907625 RepID=UPI001F3B17B2|nr:nodulation protein NfeD [Shewanella sp. AS16]MCE9686604.1 nodulation protein NfeD [Shewanella sp. AS16]